MQIQINVTRNQKLNIDASADNFLINGLFQHYEIFIDCIYKVILFPSILLLFFIFALKI